MVISRGYAMCILFLFTLLSVYYVYMRPGFQASFTHPYEVPLNSKEVSYSWTEFLGDCGGAVVVDNSVHARNLFNQKYESNIVSW